MNRIVAVVIAVFYDKTTSKFLLTQRKEIDPDDRDYGHAWNFPGGGMQFGETVEDALKREIREELGREITIIKLIPRVFSPVRRHWQGILMCYLCEFSDTRKITLNEESMDYGWFSLSEINNLKTLPLAYDIAQMAVSAA